MNKVQDQINRVHILRYISASLSIACFLFAYLNYFDLHNIDLAIVEFAFATSSLAIALFIHKLNTKIIDIIKRLYISFICIFAMGVVYSAITPSIFIFIFLIPVLSYFILGRLWGAIFSFASIIFTFFHLDKYLVLLNTDNSLYWDVLILYGGIWIIMGQYESIVHKKMVELKEESEIDSLTGINNRKSLQKNYDELILSKGNMTLFLLDIDFFKQVNDTYGHQAGDITLQILVKTIQDTFKDKDDVRIFRFGGEEFCILSVNEDFDYLLNLAEELRQNVQNTIIAFEKNIFKITCSIGLSHTSNQIENGLEKLIRQADLHLYYAKENGRNKVIYKLPKT